MVVRRPKGRGAAGRKSGCSIGGQVGNLIWGWLHSRLYAFKEARVDGLAKVREALDFWSLRVQICGRRPSDPRKIRRRGIGHLVGRAVVRYIGTVSRRICKGGHRLETTTRRAFVVLVGGRAGDIEANATTGGE